MSGKNALTRRSLIGAAAASVLAHRASAEILSDVVASDLPESKRTPLGQYLTPTEAHRAKSADRSILFVDVRDPVEITFVGHPSGIDKIIPLRTTTHDVDRQSDQYTTYPNARLVEDFATLFSDRGVGRDHPLLLTCRSGSRSATVARTLITEGYTNIWNLIEGFEGDRDGTGVRAVNGWRNAGLPWSYRLEASVAWQGPA